MNDKRTKETQKKIKIIIISFFIQKLILYCTINKQKIDKLCIKHE
jgi:hypothetical protein